MFREGEERLNFFYVLSGSLDASITGSSPEASKSTLLFIPLLMVGYGLSDITWGQLTSTRGIRSDN